MYSAPEFMLDQLRPTVAEIDLDAFSRNLRSLVAKLPPGARLMAVLKADAYGHGAVELARRCEPSLVAMIAVALMEEAVELRGAGIDLPILVLGAITPAQLPLVAVHDLRVGIVSPEALSEVAEFARHSGSRVRIHLKLDSGMGRMGLTASDISGALNHLKGKGGLDLEGVYTHFANASDPGDPFTRAQLTEFERLLGTVRDAGIHWSVRHVANSAATVTGTVAPDEYVRVGLSLYGGEPLDVGTSRLEPLMRWRTRVARLKEIEAGASVGYGTTFKAARRSRIATLPVGYADGYDRLLSNNGEVLVRGHRAPVVGRVSMDLTTIDVTDFPEVQQEDEVILLGRQGAEEISAEELAQKTNTISYEVFCRVSARVPRAYISSGQVISVRSRFARARE